MGSTPSFSCLIELRWDHPHIHGEHSIRKKSTVTLIGSPPYTWGAQYLIPAAELGVRITPIYMGSTPLEIYYDGQRKDHPHIHGEHINDVITSLNSWGSPPYTWGARFFGVVAPVRSRITPIYMGSTQLSGKLVVSEKDHPHIHGEHLKAAHNKIPAQGSPPYTWGALYKDGYSGRYDGITPIYMGSTSMLLAHWPDNQDHPHIHGEHGYVNNVTGELGRITPIYMGSTIR